MRLCVWAERLWRERKEVEQARYKSTSRPARYNTQTYNTHTHTRTHTAMAVPVPVPVCRSSLALCLYALLCASEYVCVCALFVCSWGIKRAETANEMLLPMYSYLCNALLSPSLACTHCAVVVVALVVWQRVACVCVCIWKPVFSPCYSNSNTSISSSSSGAAVLQWSVNEPCVGPNIFLMLPGWDTIFFSSSALLFSSYFFFCWFVCRFV